MKTRSSGIGDNGVKFAEEKKSTVVGVRRQLQPLQQSATDKENLVSAGTGKLMSPRKDKHAKTPLIKQSSQLKHQTKKKETEKKITITVDDLTTEGSPSLAYYEALCEKQRQALEEALAENEKLHNKVKMLEHENEQVRIVLEETKNLVQTLTEIINEEDHDEE